jgi:hypothetical protein
MRAGKLRRYRVGIGHPGELADGGRLTHGERGQWMADRRADGAEGWSASSGISVLDTRAT